MIYEKKLTMQDYIKRTEERAYSIIGMSSIASEENIKPSYANIETKKVGEFYYHILSNIGTNKTYLIRRSKSSEYMEDKNTETVEINEKSEITNYTSRDEYGRLHNNEMFAMMSRQDGGELSGIFIVNGNKLELQQFNSFTHLNEQYNKLIKPEAILEIMSELKNHRTNVLESQIAVNR